MEKLKSEFLAVQAEVWKAWEETGYAAAQQAHKEAYERFDAIRMKIVSKPVQTIEGLKVQAELLHNYYGMDEDVPERRIHWQDICLDNLVSSLRRIRL